MLLSIKNLTVQVKETPDARPIVDDISLTVPAGRLVALVGGSGSGKTTTGLSILRLLASQLQIRKGQILLENENLLPMEESRLRRVRGKEISMVFQEPLYAFNPLFRIGYQIEEVLIYHTDLNKNQRQQRVWELLNLTGLSDCKRVAQNYPHQLSGGMRQRAMIAQAIAAGPKLLIADEPTSNLDVTLQAKIMELFRKLRRELQLSILLITHDLGMVKHLADEVFVMTDGKIVEKGSTDDVLSRPQHAYTIRLKEAME